MYAVCPCVGQAENTAEPVEISFWESYSCGPKEPCIRWRSRPTHVKGFEIAFEISYKNALYKFTVIIIITTTTMQSFNISIYVITAHVFLS